ncbi:neck protein [Serratia phage PS2]|uniref:Neck protein n=1 Tax=Serratia phage PS2 TaxID=1481112 RepID=A0A023W6P0_9CAUD|nr:head closure Hc2 [Serratia phage PS2]AHY25417.1 neck protein [Serratia phage PS2]
MNLNPHMYAQLEDGSGYQHTYSSEVLNPYVNFFGCSGAQNLQDGLVAEAIQMRGVKLYYIPRQFVKPDMLFGEDLQNKFTKAWMFSAYVNTFDSYEGQGEFFSKFGYTANDEFTISINPSLFKHQCNGTEPLNGDLIYLPMDNSLFEINWVEPYDPFYQNGVNSIRKIIAQKFVYSGEEIKPQLQRNEGINIPEFSELELDPVSSLDGLADTNIEQYKETKEINLEAHEFIEERAVVNGEGDNVSHRYEPDIDDLFGQAF